MNCSSVRPKKFLGQHFLTDLSIAQRIADTVDACPDLPILEVGPGMGVMTQFLARKPRQLKVVEIDFESVAYLRRNFPDLSDGIIEDDFLSMRLDRVFDAQPFVLTGNYPYNISSQIFFKMLEYRDLIPCCTGMIQKEVAERLAAPPGSKTYGILSVLLQAWYDVEYLFTVEPGVFNPPPKVRSAVIRLTRNSRTELGCDEALFKRVVKTTFNQRRKMLRGSIKPLLKEQGTRGKGQENTFKEQGARSMGQENINGIEASEQSNPLAPCPLSLAPEFLTQRPEQLSVEDFVLLTNHLDSL